MKTLNLYIGRNLVVTTLVAVGVLTFVMFSANLIKAFELFARGVDARILVVFMLYLLPDMLTFTLPLALLCAAVLVFSRLSADNEVTAMRASGVSLWQIVTPALLLSLVLSGLCLWLHAAVAPDCRYQAYQLRKVEAVKNPLVAIEPGRFVELQNFVVRVGSVQDEVLHDVHIFVLDDAGRISQDIVARRGHLAVDEDRRVLRLTLDEAAIAVTGHQNGEEDFGIQRFATRTFSFPLDYGEALNRKRVTRRLKHMDMRMIFARIYIDSANGENVTPHYVQLHTRMSMALSPFAFLLIGIPFGIRTRRSEASVGLLVCLFLAVGFYAFLMLADGLESQPSLHPEVLVWLPNILYQAGGLWALARIARC